MRPSDPSYIQDVETYQLLLVGSPRKITEQRPLTNAKGSYSEVLIGLEGFLTTEALQPAWARLFRLGLAWMEEELSSMSPGTVVFIDFWERSLAQPDSIPLQVFEKFATEAKTGQNFFRILDDLLDLLCRLREKLREEYRGDLNAWIRQFIKQRTHCVIPNDPQADVSICHLLAEKYKTELIPTS